jgi:hypothetical protein
MALDDDPAAPRPGEISETSDLATARMLANLGTPTGAEALSRAVVPAAPGKPVLLSLDFARAKGFLQACMTSAPRVTYGLGKKVPFLNAVPGRDFTQVDCSGFVREAVREATNPTLAFPDGSVVQHDWVQAQQFTRGSVDAGKLDDGMMRIAFLRPQDVSSGIGHVVLIIAGQTLESHGGVGPDKRIWDGSSWQAKTFVYNFAQNVQFTASLAPAHLQAVVPPGPTFTVRQGHRYRATIVLSGLEQFAGNDLIAGKLTDVGFKNVVATGSGGTRTAEGTWTGPDTTAQIDPHLTDIVEIPADAAVG